MPRLNDDILSCGIDIGTTTTHLVLSRLATSNTALVNQAPRLAITRREVIYRGAIRQTPVTADGAIAAQSVAAMIEEEYCKAGIESQQVDTGAVIVTGESARLRNADEVARSLSRLAGDFVVASAGPRLESILAGRGSGAAAASMAREITICNIDIGGGTSNFAIFRHGTCVDTACLSIGGRCARLDADGLVIGLSLGGKLLLPGEPDAMDVTDDSSNQTTVQPGKVDPGKLAVSAAGAIVAMMQGLDVSPLLIVSEFEHRRHVDVDEFWISGGVGHLMGAPAEDANAYRDIGPALAQSLAQALDAAGVKYFVPADAIRATVIGAGMHSLQLSGSTIAYSHECLPLRNVPLIRLPGREVSVESLLRRNDLTWQQPVALMLDGLRESDFRSLSLWADYLAAEFTRLAGCEPFIALVAADVAMALGQLLRSRLENRQIVIIDGVQNMSGEYVDIGRPLRANALPVVIKELVFA